MLRPEKIEAQFPLELAMKSLWDFKYHTTFQYTPFYDETGKLYLTKVTKKGWQKLKLFKKQNYTCLCCNRKAAYIGLFKCAENQFYSVGVFVGDKLGDMLTKDHIIPKHNKGPSSLSNYQTLCGLCNAIKGSRTLSLPELQETVSELQLV